MCACEIHEHITYESCVHVTYIILRVHHSTSKAAQCITPQDQTSTKKKILKKKNHSRTDATSYVAHVTNRKKKKKQGNEKKQFVAAQCDVAYTVRL